MRRHSPYNYAFNNPINFVDPDEMKPGQIGVFNSTGHWDFDPNSTIMGSDFFGGSQYTPAMYVTNSFAMSFMHDGSGGNGNSRASNIILNFIRGDKLGSFANREFEENGWHVIDAVSLADALKKLTLYLGDSKADNIYINSHGLISDRYTFDENDVALRDPDTGAYIMMRDTGFYTSNDKILGSHIQQYLKDKSKLSPDTISSIDSLIKIANYVESGKNLIMGSCYSVRYDDIFGTGLSSIVKSRDIFVNRDYTSMHFSGAEGKEFITFNDFSNFNQTSKKYYINGWVWYKDGEVSKRNFNIQITKYGVKTK